MNLTITVDNYATKLYVDGVLTPLTNYDNWMKVDTITIPVDTRVIAVQGRDVGVSSSLITGRPVHRVACGKFVYSVVQKWVFALQGRHAAHV